MIIGLPQSPKNPMISIGFVGFHRLFNATYNHITTPLLKHYTLDVVEASDQRLPDFLLFSVFDSSHQDHKYDSCVKIFTCEENIRPPWHECDYAMTGDHIDKNPRHLRTPIYVRYLYHSGETVGRTIVKSHDYDARTILRNKTRFCNFVYSNPHAIERLKFLDLLSKYKTVDCGGKVRNNLGYQVDNKLKFLESYKFTIAFENSAHRGYISEKLVEPMVSNSLPIYWGCDRVGVDFNPASFVDATNRKLEDVVDQIVHLDLNDNAYIDMLSQPWFHNNKPNRYCEPDYIVEFMKQIFDSLPQIRQAYGFKSRG